MEINRDVYLERLIVRKHNGLIKIITGIRRRGNSYLLNTLFYNHLIAENIAPDHIIKKIIIVEKSMKPRYDEKGYLMMGVKEFLLDENSLMCDLIYAEMKARGNYDIIKYFGIVL